MTFDSAPHRREEGRGPEESGEPPFATASERLRHETKPAHREAERSGFLADLIRGRADRPGYALYLRNLAPVYAALESALERRDSPLLAPFRQAGLRRAPWLMADLYALVGSAWRSLPELAEARRYALAVEAADDIGLAAHAYTRYLGDLSGGQILRDVLTKSLALHETALSFYAFPDVLDIAATKDAARRSLDRLGARSRATDALIEAAKDAFRFNIDLSLAVSRAVLPAVEDIARDSFKQLRKE